MSVIEPTIDDLLSVTDENRYLLCEIAARRARDINDMMRNQHNRAEQLSDIEDISAFLSDDDGHAPNPLSIAFDEIAPKKDENGNVVSAGDLSYDERAFRISLGMPVPEVDPEELVEDEQADEDDDELIGEGLASDEEEAPALSALLDDEPPITMDDLAEMLEGVDA